jgi:hypothetical protein
MITRGQAIPLRECEEYVENVHQKEFQLPEEPDLRFRVVNCSASTEDTLSHFWYEIWDVKGNYRGEYCGGGGGLPKTPRQTLRCIMLTYKERLLPEQETR